MASLFCSQMMGVSMSSCPHQHVPVCVCYYNHRSQCERLFQSAFALYDFNEMAK